MLVPDASLLTYGRSLDPEVVYVGRERQAAAGYELVVVRLATVHGRCPTGVALVWDAPAYPGDPVATTLEAGVGQALVEAQLDREIVTGAWLRD